VHGSLSIADCLSFVKNGLIRGRSVKQIKSKGEMYRTSNIRPYVMEARRREIRENSSNIEG
jgi:hypothetical protein